MNLSQITYYLEVCNTLNFTHAAQNLYVSQPSLSRQIQLLEEELNVQLLIRSNRSVRLTAAGEVFRDEFQKIMTDIEGALNRVKASVISGKEIRIGIFQPLASNSMTKFLEQFKGAFPDYRLIIHKYSAEQLEYALKSDEIDLAVTLKAIRFAIPDIESTVIIKHRACAVFSKELYCGDKKDFRIEALNGKKLICIHEEQAPGLAEYQIQLLRQLGINIKEVVRAGDITNTILYTEGTEGFSLFYEGLSPAELIMVSLEKEDMYFEAAAYWKSNTGIPLHAFFGDFASLCDF